MSGLIALSPNVNASNYGTDLNLTMMPAAGGMGGVGVARPQDLGSAVFGNPATLTQFDGTQFMFGASYYAVDVEANHDGSTTGTPWQGKSDAGPYLIPNIAVSQPYDDDIVLAGGLSVIAGVGSDFRDIPGSLGPVAEILVFGANVGVAQQLNEHWSIGAMATIGFGLGQAGLVGNTASTSNFGIRGTAGINYASGATTLGGYYRSPLSIEYENMVQYSATGFHSATFEQPQELGFGVANESLFNGDLLLAADVLWKDWSGADGYRDLYKDQTIFALGAQYTTGPLKFRAGFTHANSPIKNNVGSSVGNIDSLLVGGTTVSMNPALVRYVQATNAEVVWEDQVSLGLGWDISNHMQLDLHAAYALKRDERIGGTDIEAGAWQTGLALTWRFE